MSVVRPDPVRAVLFDLDGVLVDTRGVWYRLLEATAEALGYPPVGREAFGATWGQGVEADVDRFYPDHEVEEVARFYEDHFADHLEDLVVLDGATEVLSLLADRSIGRAIVTNTPGPLGREIARRAGLEADHVLGQGDVPRAKPDPAMVHRALDLLDADPDEAWLVGDSRYDRGAARAAGVAFAGVDGLEGDATLASVREVLDLLGIPDR